jgi:cytidine deaminase
MPRKSYNPSSLDVMKKKRAEHTVNTNKRLEPFKHGAMVISRKGGGAVIGYGANTYNNEYGSIHAEASAFKNARSYIKKYRGVNLTNTRRRLAVDIVVLRSSGGNSKPCYHCITEQLVSNRYFNVRKVIYSDFDDTGGYTVTNCNKLYDTREEHYSGFHARVRGLAPITNNCCDGAHHEHEDGCDELGEEANENDDEEIRRLIVSNFKT